jgi:hypothetical protein
MYTNEEMLARLDSAMKTITVELLDKSILAPVKFDQFVRAMQHQTKILPAARFIDMDSQQVDIDRVGFVGRIIKSGDKYNSGTGKWEHRVLEEGEFAKPAFHTNTLLAKELQAITGLRDKALRRNIEKGNFEGTLIDLFGEAAGRDMEEFAIFADTDIEYATDDVLCRTDGWAKRAANKVYGSGGSKDFDPAANTWPENLFEALLQATPKQFLQNPSEWRIYVDWETRNDYHDLLKARGTALGDQAQSSDFALYYKGYLVEYIPMLERAKTVQAGGPGRVAMLQHPDNTAWGIFYEVTIERDRVPKDRRTDFVLTFEGDADYEDENAATVAFIDQEAPTS